jgi:hypothetical protein
LAGRNRRVVEFGHRHARQALADRLFDVSKVGLLFRRDEGERAADRFGPRGPADAVHVVLRHPWHVEVHDVA